MKILIISRSFYPGISPRSFRTTELTKELCRQGYDVTIMMPHIPKHHDIIQNEFGFKIIDLGKSLFPTLSISQRKGLNFLTRAIKRGLLQLLEYPDLGLMFQVNKKLKKINESFDVLISIAVPHPIHWGVSLAMAKEKRFAKKWIADCGDAYMGADIDTFNKPFYFKYVEHWWCKKADFISIPNIMMKKNFYPEYDSKFVEITQGFKFEETKDLLKKYKINKVPTFAFAGTFIEGRGGRDPRPFINYILTKNKRFKFIIFTKRKDLIYPYLERSNNQIELRDYIPRDRLISFLSTMDFLLNIAYDPGRQLPSKLIDYYLTERPILNIIDDQLTDEIKLNIDRFFDRDYTGRFMADNIDQYRIENVANKFIELGES